MADSKRPPEDSGSQSPPPKPAKSGEQGNEKGGWIESFAIRSAGLPPDPDKPSPTPEKAGSGRTPWSYAGLGLQFAGTVGLFTWMGYYLDKRYGWSPWGLISLSMISVIGGLYLLIKDLMKENAPPRSDRRGKT
jgi:F0F1-type ATP synthase assembly protein I